MAVGSGGLTLDADLPAETRTEGDARTWMAQMGTRRLKVPFSGRRWNSLAEWLTDTAGPEKLAPPLLPVMPGSSSAQPEIQHLPGGSGPEEIVPRLFGSPAAAQQRRQQRRRLHPTVRGGLSARLGEIAEDSDKEGDGGLLLSSRTDNVILGVGGALAGGDGQCNSTSSLLSLPSALSRGARNRRPQQQPQNCAAAGTGDGLSQSSSSRALRPQVVQPPQATTSP